MKTEVQRVLVTGGSGYIGSVLVPKLLAQGFAVRVIDAGYFGHSALDSVRDQIELLEKDVRDCTPEDLGDVDAIVHLAGFSNDPTAEFGPAENYSINAGATVQLVKLAKERGIKRFIFGSTCSVYYSPLPSDEMKDEQSRVDSRAPYSLSKYLAEIAVMAEADDTFKPIIFRQGTVYGYSPRMRYDLVVNTFVKDAFKNRALTLHHGGIMWRPLLDVRDAADAYIHFLKTAEEALVPGSYNIASFNITIRDLAERVQEILRNRHGLSVKLLGHEAVDFSKIDPEYKKKAFRSYRVSNDKILATGFTFQNSLDDAVSEIFMHTKENAHRIDATEFYNIARFEQIFKPA